VKYKALCFLVGDISLDVGEEFEPTKKQRPFIEGLLERKKIEIVKEEVFEVDEAAKDVVFEDPPKIGGPKVSNPKKSKSKKVMEDIDFFT